MFSNPGDNLHNGHKHSIILKILALLSQARWQNISVLAISQYLAVFFVLNDINDWKKVITDWVLHLIVFSGLLIVAGGYLINNFYDREKDLINRPNRTLFEAYLDKDLAVLLYLLLNALALLISLFISFRAFIFYLVFVLLLWMYSHKIKKKPMAGNLMASFLAIYPFFAVFIYYKLHNVYVALYTFLIWTLLYTRELIKDLESLKGDLMLGYKTLPVVIGQINSLKYLRLVLAVDGVIFGLFYHHTHSFLPAAGTYALSVVFVLAILLTTTFFRTNYTLITLWHNVFRILIIVGICFLAIESKWNYLY